MHWSLWLWVWRRLGGRRFLLVLLVLVLVLLLVLLVLLRMLLQGGLQALLRPRLKHSLLRVLKALLLKVRLRLADFKPGASRIFKVAVALDRTLRPQRADAQDTSERARTD